MKKQILIAIACLVAAFAFAQKKELKAAEKALKDNNYAEAKAALSQVETMMSTLDEKSKSHYHFLNAQALYAKGKGSVEEVDQAIQELNSVGTSYASDAAEFKNIMLKKFLEDGSKQYGNRQYGLAAGNFESSYRIFPQDTVFLYNAAISADLGEEVDKAIGYYTELKDLGYTGIETEYIAVNKETGEEEVLPSKEEQKLYVQSGQYIKPSERKSDSKRPDIIKRIALLYVSQDKKDEAIAAVKEARAQNPKDIDLIITEANLYYNLKDVDRYRALIEEATKIDPNNADLYYNLGVVSAQAKDIENAEKYYKKALDIDPNYTNAKLNLAATILMEDEAIRTEMNNLSFSDADTKRFEELKIEQANIYRKAIPYLKEVVKDDPNNDDALRTLMNIYSALGEDSESNLIKEKLDQVSKANRE